ncbi:MAG: hypothetical protein V8R91_06665 [Butyricimonas faecihominis]
MCCFGIITRESIGNLTKVTEIDVSQCTALTSLPASLGQLTGLKKLTMPRTGLTTLPAAISSLSALEELDVTWKRGYAGESVELLPMSSLIDEIEKIECK